MPIDSSIAARPTISRGTVFAAIALAAWSCQGVTSTVETLRAEKLEIVDKEGALQMDVPGKIRSLEDRVQKLETALAKRAADDAAAAAKLAAASAPTPSTPAASAPANAASASASPAKPAPPRPSAAPKGGGPPEFL